MLVSHISPGSSEVAMDSHLAPGSVYCAGMFLGSASAVFVGQVLLTKPDFAM